MSSNAELLLDTSAAIALVDPASPHHDSVLAATSGHLLGLSGHVAFEFWSVLTRLPFPMRITSADANRLITVNFPGTKYLEAGATAELIGEFAQLGIVGGAVYDALVAACARAHRLPLLTCDRRAEPTYKALAVNYRLTGV